MFYTNDYLNPIINGQIVEYDIKSGNTSIMRTYRLAPEKEILQLESLDKKERVVEIGKKMRRDKEFSKKLEKGFNDAVQQFIKQNQIPHDKIVSIKRDAVFVSSYPITQLDVGDSIHFVPKNEYCGFIKLNHLEFYIRSDKTIDVKGISDDKLYLHEDGVLDIIRYGYQLCVDSNMDYFEISRGMSELVQSYKGRELSLNSYREFNPSSAFRIHQLGKEIMMENISEAMLNRCDIYYNYDKIIIPLIRVLC